MFAKAKEHKQTKEKNILRMMISYLFWGFFFIAKEFADRYSEISKVGFMLPTSKI